jgi:hypothetical protein
MGDFAVKCSCPSYQDFLESFDINNGQLIGGTQKNLNIICKKFNLEQGFAELEKDWKLSS